MRKVICQKDFSIRDQFAADALIGLMLRYKEPGYTDAQAAHEAYKIADMMLEERYK